MLMRDIREDPMLLDIWRDMSRDLIPLMRHIVRATGILVASRDPDDRKNSPSSMAHSSSTPSIDEGGHDTSPHPPPPPSPHLDHEQATHIPPPPPLSSHLDEQARPIPHPPLSPLLDEHARPIPPLLISGQRVDQPLPLDHPSSSTTYQASTILVDMQIIPSVGPDML
jgi:hypothetical protein